MSLSAYFYDPFHEPFFTGSEFNRLFDAAWDARLPKLNRDAQPREDATFTSNVLRPRMDLHESKDKNEMTATFELPGMKKEDVSIDVRNNRLVVSGQSTILNALDREGYAVRERRFGHFSRTLPLPSEIQPEDIKANMDHGVLTVRFTRGRPDQEPKKIAIE